MVNTRQKGNRSVRKARDYYEEQGWKTDVVEKTGKFIFEKDLYGLFDVVGIKKNQVIFVQVKTNRPPTREPFKDFAKDYAGKNLRIQSYTWYDRRGPIIHSFLSSGKITKKDLRK